MVAEQTPPQRPQIFAIMRNGHEVIRGAMKDIETALANDDLVHARALWDDLHRWDNLHMQMEEGREGGPRGLFNILDEHADGIVTQKELRHHHQHLYEYEEDIADAFAHAANVSEAVKASFQSFQKENLIHLQVEEQVMMPSLQRLAKEGKPMKRFMCEDVFPAIPTDEVEFFIKFANQVLARHEDGMPRVRVFNHALWATATPEQWTQWKVWIQESLSKEKLDQTMAAIDAWKAYQAAQASKTPTEPCENAKITEIEGKSKRGGITLGIKKLFRRTSSNVSATSSVRSGSSQ